MACGGEAGQDLPSTFAADGLVAAGELASDHGGAQRSLGPVVGGLQGRVVQEGEQPAASFSKPIGHLGGAGGQRGSQEQFVGPVFQVLTLLSPFGRRQVGSMGLQINGCFE